MFEMKSCCYVITFLIASALFVPARAETVILDFTHPIPSFKPSADDPMKPDLDNPWHESTPIPSFGQQTVLSVGQFPTNWGTFDLGTLILSEHHGTHLDMPAHYLNMIETMEEGGIPVTDRPEAHESDVTQLVGPIVLIDISDRIQAELAKNGGTPSPDTAVTDFSEASGNVITAADIEAVADRLKPGAWLVLNLGWSGFYFDGPDFASDPYINNWNHPGLSKAAVDKLIEISETNGRIAGIVADNIGVETGESAHGIGDQWKDSWYAHRRLLQRGFKFVENAADLDQLAAYSDEACTLIVGAPKHTRGTGGPSRVIAMCEQ